MTLTLFLQVILFSHLGNTAKKVFLVETVTSQSVRDIIGEDYANGKHYGKHLFDSMDKCKNFCPHNCIYAGRHVPNQLGFGPPRSVFNCLEKPTSTTTTTTTNTTTTTSLISNGSCRTPRSIPRSLRGKKNKWGFRLKTMLRGSNNFCCIRGPRTGDMLRGPRCCKGRTPRSACWLIDTEEDKVSIVKMQMNTSVNKIPVWENNFMQK